MQEISNELNSNYKINLEARENEQIEQLQSEDLQQTSTRHSSELPKKILDIPSSDEESANVGFCFYVNTFFI